MVRRILSFTALLTFAFAALHLLHVRLRHRDLPFYRKLVQESADLQAHSALEASPVRQLRRGVRKDIWTVKDGRQVHGRVVSADSEMILTQKKEKIEATELLSGIEAWIEGDGQIRHLTAESGVSYFPSCRMTATHLVADMDQGRCVARQAAFERNGVELSGSFHLDHPMGRLFGEKGFLNRSRESLHLYLEEGVLFEAASVPFSISSSSAVAKLPASAPFVQLASQKIEFFDDVEIMTVSGLRATGGSAIIQDGALTLLPDLKTPCSLLHDRVQVDAKEIQFDRRANELVCFSPHGRLEQEKTLFDADTGRAAFGTSLQPQTLLLEGSVRIASFLQGQESFALADSAICHLNERKIVLESVPGARVLFHQKGLDVSAPTIHIQKAVQAFGDVRFYFYPEEKSALDAMFPKFTLRGP